MRFGPNHQGNMAARVVCCCFEWLKSEGSQSWNFCEESISQRLKKSKKFAFSNSPFTRQQNISLNGTKSKMFDRVSRKCFINNLTCKACHERAIVSVRAISKEMAF